MTCHVYDFRPRSTPLKKVNRARRGREWARAYESPERVAWIKSRACMVWLGMDCDGPIECAHVANGGAGRKADARFIVGLCRRHHRILHTLGVRTFEKAYTTELTFAAQLTEQRWQEHLLDSMHASHVERSDTSPGNPEHTLEQRVANDGGVA